MEHKETNVYGPISRCGDGNGFCYGDGSGYGDGHGSGFRYGYGYGSSYGDGHGSGDGYGYGYGNGHGYGDGHGQGVKVGVLCGYDIIYQHPWPYVKIGCRICSVEFWEQNWKEIAREEGIEIILNEEAKVEAFLRRIKKIWRKNGNQIKTAYMLQNCQGNCS